MCGAIACMLYRVYLPLVFVLFSACAQKPVQELKANDQFGWIYPGPENRTARVIVIPQWHLAPQTNTVYSKSAGLPQSQNQLAIYRQLVEWIDTGRVQSVVVEGCEGEIDDSFRTSFNGWSLEALQKMSSTELDGVMTQVGLKIKARVGSKVRVLCGDDLALIKKHQLILSDLRGLMGFRLRLAQYQNDEAKLTDYLSGARGILKMAPETSGVEVSKELDAKLRAKLAEFRAVLRERNAAFVRVAKFAPAVSAVVIGAIHVTDLREQFKTQNIASLTFEPRGLSGDENELLDQIEKLFKDQK